MVKDIMEKGYVTGKPNVGILMNDVSSEAQRYGIPADRVVRHYDVTHKDCPRRWYPTRRSGGRSKPS